jgi:hypothetical protein
VDTVSRDLTEVKKDLIEIGKELMGVRKDLTEVKSSTTDVKSDANVLTERLESFDRDAKLRLWILGGVGIVLFTAVQVLLKYLLK